MEDKNNSMVSFDCIIDEYFGQYDVYIPLIQRNYKWDAEMAAKLAVDLWKAFENKQDKYTVGMITFCKEQDKVVNGKPVLQLIDGQQRIITLFMLLKFVMPEEKYFSFRFERDEGIDKNKNRETYLSKLPESLEWEDTYTDINRFKTNYNKIKEKIVSEGYNEARNAEFVNYIRNNVYFLLHISETEPFDEFMNLNHNKTRFVISDLIKANLIIDSKNYKEKILDLFNELSKVLFLDNNVWDLVKQGYEENETPDNNEKRKKDMLYQDENRLKLLCCERYGDNEYDVSSTLGYEYNKELDILTNYSHILSTLSKDIENNNWNSYNAFNCLYTLKEIPESRFFNMIKDNSQKRLEEYLLNEAKDKERDSFQKACFIESQLQYGKVEKKEEKLPFLYMGDKDVREELNEDKLDKAWISNGKDEFDIFAQIYSGYIAEKYKAEERENYGD